MFHAFSDLWTDRNNQNPLKTLEKKKKKNFKNVQIYVLEMYAN